MGKRMTKDGRRNRSLEVTSDYFNPLRAGLRGGERSGDSWYLQLMRSAALSHPSDEAGPPPGSDTAPR
jgi:hypothetical protein